MAIRLPIVACVALGMLACAGTALAQRGGGGSSFGQSGGGTQGSTGGFGSSGSSGFGSTGGSSFGGGTGGMGSTGGGMGGTGQAGSMQQGTTGSAFTSFAPTAEGFVGRDSVESQQIQQATSGAGDEMGQQDQSRSSMNRGRNVNNQQSAAPAIRVKLKVAFDQQVQLAATTNANVSKVLNRVLNENLVSRQIGVPDVLLDGRMVTLRGTVPTSNARRLVENLVKMQPGVDKVVNELIVVEPSAESILPGTTN